MVNMYYKIPPKYVEELGLTSILPRHPDGNYLASRAVMARINPDIDKALAMTGGIALTPDQARDDQIGHGSYPLPGAAEPQESRVKGEESSGGEAASDKGEESRVKGEGDTDNGQRTTDNAEDTAE